MSYYFKMYFKKVNSLEEGVKTLNNFIDEYTNAENLEKVIEYNYLYILGQIKRVCNIKLKDLNKNDFWEHFYLFRSILQPVLGFNALYWPQFKLLGLCFNEAEDIIDKYFDGFIEFQNSCDQDYDYETWNVLGNHFTNKAKEYKNISIERLLNELNWISIEDIKDNNRLDYYKKVALYTYIYKTLDLNNWLWDKKSPEEIFIPLNLCVPLWNDNEVLIDKMITCFIRLYKMKGE